MTSTAITGDNTPEQRTLVWKFGGTSVANQERLSAVADRMVAAHRAGNRVVAVLSAMGKSTDELSALAYQLTDRPPLRELDALLSVGEQISCALASMAVHALGAKAISLTGEQAGVLTDGMHGNARLLDVRPDRVTAELDEGSIVLVTGYQGVTETGEVTTLGRGGSDASAVALAAGLGLTECEIFTDVPGVFSADPRIVPDARQLVTMRHEEMLEMAEAGAGVLQPRSVELAAAHGVDIHLRSSFGVEDGTWIRRADRTEALESQDGGVAGIAHRRHEPLYAAEGVSAAEVTIALASRGAAVGAIVPEADGVRFTAPGVEAAEVAAALAALDAPLRTYQDLGTVSVVSLGISRKPELMARALTTLEQAGIAARFVTTTPGRISVHVAAEEVDTAVRLLHRAFIPADWPVLDGPAEDIEDVEYVEVYDAVEEPAAA